MNDEEFDKENQAAMDSKEIKTPLQRAESVVSASTNNKLDMVAAKAGGALSASAVFLLAKKKKKGKAPGDTTMVPASTCPVPSTPKGGAWIYSVT
jgi:hypothetical protein